MEKYAPSGSWPLELKLGILLVEVLEPIKAFGEDAAQLRSRGEIVPLRFGSWGARTLYFENDRW